jgi:hypothetical protein
MKLKLGKKLANLGLRPVDGADELTTHYTIAVDYVGLGKFEGAIEIIAALLLVADGEQTNAVIVEESLVCRSIPVNADSNYGYTAVFQALLQLHQRRHFFDAGHAPCRPEIQNNNLSPELVQGDPAVGVLHGEVRGYGSNTRWPGACIASRKQERQRS